MVALLQIAVVYRFLITDFARNWLATFARVCTYRAPTAMNSVDRGTPIHQTVTGYPGRW